MSLEYKGNVANSNASEESRGLWDVYEVDGRSSLTEHELKTVWVSCPPKEHYFELTDSGKRECTCNKCGFITTFIVGLQSLSDGKIINLR